MHLRGSFHVTQPAFRAMREQGYGRLLFVTSASGLFGNFGQANYAAAKMGLVGLALTAAIDGARYGIQSNAIAPLARTPMTAGLFGGAIEAFDPEFVVPMALYLVSESCRLTHEIFSAGGRRFARVVVGVTPGWVSGDAPTLEDVHEHLAEIRAEAISSYRAAGSSSSPRRSYSRPGRCWPRLRRALRCLSRRAWLLVWRLDRPRSLCHCSCRRSRRPRFAGRSLR